MSNRSCFSSYIDKEENTIVMINDAACKSMRVDFMQIQMFDSVIRTLTNVYNVPELQKLLFSLRQSDSLGCKIIIEKIAWGF